MAKNKNLVGLYYTKITKSIRFLEYSFKRTSQMPTNPTIMNDIELEAWDGFAVRFARTSDIFLSKYIRAYLLADDPSFDGGFRDQLNRAEKLGLIQDVATWMEIRELRNATVHEYSDQDLEKIFEKLRKFSYLLFELPKRLKHEAE